MENKKQYVFSLPRKNFREGVIFFVVSLSITICWVAAMFMHKLSTSDWSSWFVLTCLLILLVDSFYRALNFLTLSDDEIKYYHNTRKYDGMEKMTIFANVNSKISVKGDIYIYRISGTGYSIYEEMPYMLISNHALDKNYKIAFDRDVIVSYDDERFLDALRQRYSCHIFDDFEDEEEYYYPITPEVSETVKPKRIIRSWLHFGFSLFLTACFYALYVTDGGTEIAYATLKISYIAGILYFIFWGLSYYIVTEEYVALIAFPFFTVMKIDFKDIAEIGIAKIAKGYVDRGSSGVTPYYYLYFTHRTLTIEQRRDFYMIPKSDYIKIPYNKALHKYLEKGLGIDVKGVL